MTISKTTPGGGDDVSYELGSNVGTGGAGSTSSSVLPDSGGSGRILISAPFRYLNLYKIDCRFNNTQEVYVG